MARPSKVGRPSKKRNIMYFNFNKFYTDLKKELKKATSNIRNAILHEAKRNARRLKLRTNRTVRFYGQDQPVSDYDRRKDLIDSITTLQTKWLESQVGEKALNSVLSMGVGAMEQNASFKKSYIGLYYEYGIGGQQDPSGYWIEEMADPNPFRRPGEPSVTRSKLNPRNQAGKWKDLGGNIRITNSFKGGRRAPILKMIGRDFAGEFWFRRAFERYTKSNYVAMQYRTAVLKCHPAKYIVIPKKKFVLGRD